MSLTETALQTLLNLLQTTIPSIIQAQPTTYNCPEPNLYKFGTPDLKRASQMPILAVDLDREELSTRTLGGVNASRRQKTLPALIYIYHAHRDEEQLLREIIQLADATVQALEQLPQNQNYLYQTPRLVDLSPPIETTQHPYIRVAAISVTMLITHRQAQ